MMACTLQRVWPFNSRAFGPNVSYQQMVVSLSHAPLQTLSHAIEALRHAKEQRSQEA